MVEAVQNCKVQEGDSGRATKGAWVEGVLPQLSVALCKGIDCSFRAIMHDFCRAAGRNSVMPQCPTPFYGLCYKETQ